MIVVDNSVVLPLFVEDEDSSQMEKLLQVAAAESCLIVPRLWVNEFGNGILVCTRRGRMSEKSAFLAHEKAVKLPIEMVSFPEIADLNHVHQLAKKHALSFYDASYLALAIHRGGKLATNDKKLSRAAIHEGIFYSTD